MPLQLAANGLPETSSWLFPEYEFARMHVEEYAGVIIERVLERGSWTEVNWLFGHYGEDRIAGWVRKHAFRLLSPCSFNLWRLMLNVDDFEAPDWALKAGASGW
jgi:hypothetical protein